MADQKQDAEQAAYKSPSTGKPFADMDGSEKVSFIGKVFVMLITGGFAFPNVFVE